MLEHLKSDIKSYGSTFFKTLKILDLLLCGLVFFFHVLWVVLL